MGATDITPFSFWDSSGYKFFWWCYVHPFCLGGFMKVYREVSVADFEGWSGAQDVVQMMKERGLIEEFDTRIEELYPEGINEIALNDVLRFDTLEMLGLEEE